MTIIYNSLHNYKKEYWENIYLFIYLQKWSQLHSTQIHGYKPLSKQLTKHLREGKTSSIILLHDARFCHPEGHMPE